jgi:hypothetical protein
MEHLQHTSGTSETRRHNLSEAFIGVGFAYVYRGECACVLSVYVCTCVIRKKIFTTYTFSVPWAGERDELARWRRPCEMAAAGEACDGRGESARAGAVRPSGHTLASLHYH